MLPCVNTIAKVHKIQDSQDPISILTLRLECPCHVESKNILLTFGKFGENRVKKLDIRQKITNTCSVKQRKDNGST